jgi:hypothetical protein
MIGTHTEKHTGKKTCSRKERNSRLWKIEFCILESGDAYTPPHILLDILCRFVGIVRAQSFLIYKECHLAAVRHEAVEGANRQGVLVKVDSQWFVPDPFQIRSRHLAFPKGAIREHPVIFGPERGQKFYALLPVVIAAVRDRVEGIETETQVFTHIEGATELVGHQELWRRVIYYYSARKGIKSGKYSFTIATSCSRSTGVMTFSALRCSIVTIIISASAGPGGKRQWGRAK